MKIRILYPLLLAAWVMGATYGHASEITPEGQKLAAVLDSMDVEHLWLAGHRVNWRTGEPTGKALTNAASHTHCSAFVAAAAEKLGVYVLRPPEHSATLLANAQQDWLKAAGTNDGWRSVTSPIEAQLLANSGHLVLVTCKNPHPTAPGHIAIVRPSTKSDELITAEGPQVIQAGRSNYVSTTTREGFKNHGGAFERNELLYFVHDLTWPAAAPTASVAAEKPGAAVVSGQ